MYNNLMLQVVFAIIIRIISNSYLNVFQKILTKNGSTPSVVNFFTYFGLSIIAFFIFKPFDFSVNLIPIAIMMGILGALGNYFIIKALSFGELSSLAPINSYKPIVALVFGIFFLGEMPNLKSVFGIILIILSSYFILNKKCATPKKAVFYRFLALIFSGLEAIFIKKIILMTNVQTSFLIWAVSGLFFAFFFALFSKNKTKFPSFKHQTLLIICTFLMQYSTNFVFSKINVAYALSLFQLSIILSVFLGISIFSEENLKRKILASIFMIIGAVIIILS